MKFHFQSWNDTIVAQVTPNGIGAIGIIRISGVLAFPLVNSLFQSKNIEKLPSHSLHIGFLKYNSEVIDQVVLSLYRAPHSYTGEDVIEISCHGSHYILERVILILIELGCRLAKPGEFTQRAFLNNKLNLAEAESVADLIDSNTKASATAALNTLRGGFKSVLNNLREQLLTFSALLELELDFAEEDVEFADRSRLDSLIFDSIVQVSALCASFKYGNVIKNGIQTAIIGAPNAGKSTLLNTLLNENRAIVSNIPGTTRDTIEEVLNIDGILFRLIDTAGLRLHSKDEIENLGIERSLDKMQSADLIVYLFDVNEFLPDNLKLIVDEFTTKSFNFLLVGNKIDLIDRSHESDFKDFDNIIFISAMDKINIEDLRKQLIKLAIGGEIKTESTIITNVRHFEALNSLFNVLQEVLNGLRNNLTSDLIALHIRECLHYLGLITGEVTTEDQLDYIFSKFCIGK